MTFKRSIKILLLLSAIAPALHAADYVVVGATTNLYQEPTTSTPMLNQWDDKIDLLAGMAFATTGESGDFYRIDIPGWKGAWLPKSACVTPAPLDFEPGTYQFSYEGESIPVAITPTAEKGVYTVSYPRMDGLKGLEAEPGIIVIVNTEWDNEVVGCVTRLDGTLRVWIYDTTVLPWN